MGVGINGMGRIGRLALRASLGAMDRPDDDPRARNRLDIVHVNEVKGGAAVAAHLLEFDSLHGRWRQKFAAEDDQAIVIGNRRIGFSAASLPGEVAVGRSRLRHRPRMHGEIPEAGSASGLFRQRRSPRHRRGACQGPGGPECRRRRQRRSLRPGRASAADGSVVYHQLPRPDSQGRARSDRHPARPDHDDPRSHQHQRRSRCAAQGSAARQVGDAVVAAHHHGQRDRNRADLSGAEGAAERTCGARARAQRVADGLRLRAGADDERG